MLLLVTILLVLVAAVTLLIGIFSDELTLIFVSIGASALAAIVLAVLSQMSRKKGRAAASEASAPEPLPARQTPASDTTAEEAAASIEEIGQPVTVPAEATTTAVPAVAHLAIENYDALRVNEILPKLEGLDLDELEDIAQHEESRKNRTTVLNRIDALMDQLEAAASTATTPAAEVTDELAAEAATSIEEIGEPVVAIADDGADDATDDGFPIPNYDSLSESDLIPLLADLDADQLEAVADREEAGPNRDAVLDAIDDRLDVLEGIVPAPAAASAAADEAAIEEEEAADELPVMAATRAPAKKATAKRAAVKKAPAPRKVAAAPAKKAATTAAKAAAAKKATPAKATRKTPEPAKKAPAAKRAVKAAPAVKKAPTATVKAAAKKAPAKKATAAKKAAKR